MKSKENLKKVNKNINTNVKKYFIVSKDEKHPEKGNKVSVPLLVKYVKDKYDIKLYHNQFRIYDNNYYKHIENIKQLIHKEIPEEYRYPKDIEACEKLLRMDSSLVLKDSNLANERYINFKNGILNASNMVFKTHDDEKTKNLIFINQVNYDYNPSAEKCDYVDNFFNSITNENEEDINFLLQVLGVLISNYRSFKNIFYFTGVKDSGKSVFLHIAENLLKNSDGSRDYSSYGLRALTDENSKELTGIIGKKANICGETPKLKISSDTLLKQMSGGDTITFYVKFEDPVTFINKAMLIFSGNKVPSFFVSDTSSISERMMIYEFKNSIPPSDQIKCLENKMNMEYIIIKAIEQLKVFINNNQEFATPSEVLNNRTEILKKSDIIYDFYTKCVIVTNNNKDRISTKDLFDYFKNFLVKDGHVDSNKLDFSEFEISQNKFTTEIKKYHGQKNFGRNLMYNDIASDVYTNIKINKDYSNDYKKHNNIINIA